MNPAIACHRPPRPFLALLLAFLFVPGCWSFRLGPDDLPFVNGSGAGEAEAILRVNEAGVPWGNGKLGPAIRDALESRGVFSTVHYPVEPDPSGLLRIEVVGLGKLDEAVIWGVLASSATGFFFFLPAPVLPYFQDYEGTLNVTIYDQDQVVSSFEVEAETSIVSAIMAPADDYYEPAVDALVQHLATRVTDEVQRRM